MSRPIRCRIIEKHPISRCFSPVDIEAKESIEMTVDEYETIRLLDGEGFNQKECADKMGVSRTTVTSIYELARKKMADALVNGKRLLIVGGRCKFVPVKITQNIIKKEIETMRIAVTYEDGEVFQHFGHCEHFKLYDVDDGKIVKEQMIDSNGSGHGALAGLLQLADVDVLICGGIGGGAQMALFDAGIQFYAGFVGNADEMVKSYINGALSYNPNARCDHHGEHVNDSCMHGQCANRDCKDK